MIWRRKAKMKNKRRSQRLNSYAPISKKEPLSIITEQYRKLRTNIEFSNFNKEIKTIALTSTSASEGKTVTSLNLATVYAQSGLNTLIIDMDLRKPKVHRGFGLINDRGLTNIITEKLDYKDVIQKVDDHLFVLTSGKKLPFPAEFYLSDTLLQLMKELRETYDRIIIDTPPLSAVTDATIISSFVDGVILVIASRKTRIDFVDRALRDLNESKANIIGAVLTKVQKRENHYNNYYAYYHDDKKK